MVASFSIRQMMHADLPAVTRLEVESFPSDEIATPETIRYRMTHAPHLCYVAVDSASDQIIGFIAATSAPDDTPHLEEHMMLEHVDGTLLCVHSVVVRRQSRRHGLGTSFLREYLQIIRRTTRTTRILLICKPHLIPFYVNVGFQQVGPSSIVHGKDKWIEMVQHVGAN